MPTASVRATDLLNDDFGIAIRTLEIDLQVASSIARKVPASGTFAPRPRMRRTYERLARLKGKIEATLGDLARAGYEPEAHDAAPAPAPQGDGVGMDAPSPLRLGPGGDFARDTHSPFACEAGGGK